MEKEEKKNHIIDLDKKLNPLSEEVQRAGEDVDAVYNKQLEMRDVQKSMLDRMNLLASQMGVEIEKVSPDLLQFQEVNREIDACYEHVKQTKRKFPELSPIELLFTVVSGILSVAIDVVFVGTPDIVKLRNGKENFDGGVFTTILRKIGADENQQSYAIFHWLSEKCKVPYDMSAVTGVMYPNNHRIRSLGHDPFLGLFFAVADIAMGTTTCVDNTGHLRILVGDMQVTSQEKMLSVFYYVGHITSDICTARGIPVPGFFLTQFFTGDGGDDSLAKKAEMMYLNGYDMRHLASQAVPVVVKNLLIDTYFLLTRKDENAGLGIAEREVQENLVRLKREKMMFISDCVAVGGNLGKILLPPNCGNLAALNYVQWLQFIKNSLAMLATLSRDTTVEEALDARKEIDSNWKKLLNQET